MGLYTLLVTLLCTVVLPVLLLLAAVKLWQVLVIRGLEPNSTSPLPPGTMGLPFIGETLQLILQVKLLIHPDHVYLSDSSFLLRALVYLLR